MNYSEHELPALLATDLRHYYPFMVMLYQHRLSTFARRLTGSTQDAEDIVQEAFVGAYVSLENYPTQRIQSLKLQAWLYKVTLNVYNHHIRGARLHLVPLNLAADSPLLAIEDSQNEQPEVWLETQEHRQELEELVARLPERYRVAVACYYFEHLTYQEVAELLDQPTGTVKSTISRGIRLLRNLLTTTQPEGRENQLWNTRTPNNKKA